MNRIIVLDPQSPESRRLVRLLESKGYLPVQVADPASLREASTSAAAVFCGPEQLDAALGDRSIPVLLIDSAPTIARAVAAIKAGAADYLDAKTGDEEVLHALSRALRARTTDQFTTGLTIIGISTPMKTLTRSISKIAPTESTVLITGESGTGKELVARALHAGSQRRFAPLISLNCATVPESLIESELFGHDTDPSGGLLEDAAGGTLFLDEIGELPASAQASLLKALEEGQNIRLICASHRDLTSLVATGQFRDDLYYRLKVVSLTVPPLREREGDVLLLADAILTRTMEKLGKSELEFGSQAREDMRRYHWPGNVRELENAIERAVILCESATIDTEMLAIEPPKASAKDPSKSTAPPDQTIEDYFVSFVTTHQDNMTETELAEKLGISRKSLWERRQRLNIPRKKTPKRGRRRDIT